MKASIAKQLAANASKRWEDERESKQALEFDWSTSPLSKCKERLAQLLQEFNTGSKRVQEREGSEGPSLAYCCECEKGPLKQWVNSFVAKSPSTGLLENHYLCSPHCFEVHSHRVKGGLVK